MEYRLRDLNLWEDNPHDGDVGMLMLDIKRFGYNRTIAVWKNNIVMAGNTTFKALLSLYKLDSKTPPKNVKQEGDEWIIEATDISFLSQDEAIAYGIADNRAHERGSDDPAKLAELLQLIAENDDKSLLEATGFDGDDIDDLLYQLNPTFDPYDEWDGMPEFEQDTIKPYHSIKVHFEKEEDLKAFAKLVEQTISNKTTYIYYPKQVKADLASLHYES